MKTLSVGDMKQTGYRRGVSLGVRTAAAESLPFLLECARIRGPEYLTQMWQFICPELLKAVDSEPELDVKAEHMYAVAQVLMHVLL